MNEMPKPKVAVVGGFQNGKSTLINCLLDDYVAPTGIGLPTTHISTTYTYGEIESVTLSRKDGTTSHALLDAYIQDYESGQLGDYTSASITQWKPLLRHIDLVDTPGFNANEADTKCATEELKQADFALFLVSNCGLSQDEKSALRKIDAGTPCAVIINTTERVRWNPAKQDVIIETISSDLKSLGIKPLEVVSGHSVWCCNLGWFWEVSGHLDRELRLRKCQENHAENSRYQKAEALKEDVDHFWRKQCIAEPLERAKWTRFVELRQGLDECLWRSLSIIKPMTRRIVNESVDSWRQQVRSSIETAKSNLSKKV